MTDEAQYNLLSHNTFGISVLCRRFVEIDNAEEAKEFLPEISRERLLFLGGGSNILFTKDFDGTVVRSAVRGIKAEAEGRDVMLHCGSGERWDDVAAFAVNHHFYGAENLSHIPGDTGAAAVQNIGAYGAEIGPLVESVTAVETASGKLVNIGRGECEYAYRSSRFKRDWRGRFFITGVTLRLSREYRPQLDYGNIRGALEARKIDFPTAEQLRETIIAIRDAKLPDPTKLGNAGSFFMNPVVAQDFADELLRENPGMPVFAAADGRAKLSAGWMIEACGWKGKRLGRAGVYAKQALALVNCGGASGEEILALARAVQRNVRERFGVELVPEVNIF
ncbi:MAG: UDP-N-acetylmuramate dehydrogenase [Prevotella sp.]|nr:UDP-N-acetylmuramate dehydrogenase [Prevotella sp.]